MLPWDCGSPFDTFRFPRAMWQYRNLKEGGSTVSLKEGGSEETDSA
jgi:hypothetical protein